MPPPLQIIPRYLEHLPGVPMVMADTETNGLALPYLQGGRRAWDYALVRRDPDGLQFWLEAFVDLRDLPWDPSDTALDREGLNVGRFYQRHPQINPDAPGLVLREADIAKMIWEFFHQIPPAPGGTKPRKPWLWGINPSFEQDQFGDLLRRHGFITNDEFPWYHAPQCARGYAAGALRVAPPWTSERVAAVAGVDIDAFDLHTARGDVEFGLALYEAALKPAWARRVARGQLALRRALKRSEGRRAA